MKRLILLVFLLCWMPAFGLISPDLERVIASAEPEKLIQVDIVFKNQMNVQELRMRCTDCRAVKNGSGLQKYYRHFQQSSSNQYWNTCGRWKKLGE